MLPRWWQFFCLVSLVCFVAKSSEVSEYTPETISSILAHPLDKHVLLFVKPNETKIDFPQWNEVKEEMKQCLFLTVRVHRENQRVLKYFRFPSSMFPWQSYSLVFVHQKKQIDLTAYHNISSMMQVMGPLQSFCLEGFREL